MKKRQIKKNAKWHVHLVGDEFNLAMMNDEERAEALQESERYRLELAKKPYRELKRLGVHNYYYAPPKRHDSIRQHVGTIGKGSVYTANEYVSKQSLEGIDGEVLEKLKKKYAEK